MNVTGDLSRRSHIHRQAYFYLLFLLAAVMPLSVFATSALQLLLLLNWVVEGRFGEKFRRLREERAFMLFALFYLLHLAGMAWSADLVYGLSDLKIKLPILFLPLLVVTSRPLTTREVRSVLTAFIAGSLAGSAATVMALLEWIPAELTDYRNASLFINHIRFSLMVVLAILFAGYLFVNRRDSSSRSRKWFCLLSMVWLSFFLVVLRSLSGLIIILLVVLFLLFRQARKVRQPALRAMLSALIIIIPLAGILYTVGAVKKFYTVEKVDFGKLDPYTSEGNRYIHHKQNREIENGNFVWIYLCPEELKREWARVSDIPYMGKAENGDMIRFTLIRYLASKGLRKDAEGVRQLTEEDVAAIEKGIANHIYLNRFALYPRIYELIWEFDRYRLGYGPNDKSLIQRYFYLKAGVSIAGDHLLYGVGTGDVRNAFDQYYRENNSPLREERRRRAHNQYLTLVIAFGIPGLLVGLYALTAPVFIKRRWRSYLVIVFLLTMALSMLDEDTLENTSGAVLFGLFYALFIFGPSDRG